MGVVDRECVGIIPTLTTLAGISKVLEAVKASACGVVLIREFPAHQIVVGEAMVDLNVKLPIGSVARTRCEPVVKEAPPSDIGLWKVAHHLLRHRVNQIAGYIGGETARTAWTRIGGDVVEGNEGTAYDAALTVTKNPGPWVKNLTSVRTASPGTVERASFCSTKFAEITCPHGIAGNACLSRARAVFGAVVIVEEEEGSVLEDWAANGTAVIVAAQRRNGLSISVGEPVVRIETVVAEKLINATVKLVGSRARDYIDHRGARKPVFRAEIGLLDFEFLNCLD